MAKYFRINASPIRKRYSEFSYKLINNFHILYQDIAIIIKKKSSPENFGVKDGYTTTTMAEQEHVYCRNL